MPLVEKGTKTGAMGGTDPYKESSMLVKGLANSDGTIDDVINRTRSPYFEYQVHGGVKASEIGEIHYYNDAKPDKKIEKWAKDNGVAIVKHPTPTGTIKKKGIFDDVPDDWWDDG
jgi:rRNA processing protein Gar1